MSEQRILKTRRHKLGELDNLNGLDLHQVIEFFRELVEKYGAYATLEVRAIEVRGFYEYQHFEVIYESLETDKEVAARINKRDKAKLKREYKKRTKEENERAEYERLKKIYGAE